MKIFSAVTLSILISGTAMAGGDFTLGNATKYSYTDETHKIVFSQTEEEPYLIKGCPSITVLVKHERVPWFSWLPFIQSNHPTKTQTETAAKYIQNSIPKNESFYLGYMGYGLAATDIECTYHSRGLKLEHEQNKRLVLSFYGQI